MEIPKPQNPAPTQSPKPETESVKPVERLNIPKLILTLFLIILILSIAIGILNYFSVKPKPKPTPTPAPEAVSKKEFKKFQSEQEFLDFLKKGGEGTVGYFGFGPAIRTMDLEIKAPEGLGGGADPERVSETNVQVQGIDEPDIVKTDGLEIYFSSDRPIYYPVAEPMIIGDGEERVPPPRRIEQKTKTIKAFPPQDLAKIAEIDKIGNLLLTNNILVVFTNDRKIYGFDVTDPKNPTERWKVELNERDWLEAARLYNNKVYFITKTNINRSRPCPIIPLTVGEVDFSVSCTNIYHPVVDMPVDATFNAFILNPESGQIEKNVSFVGSSSQSMVYMSPNALYTTYNYNEDILDFMYNFYSETGQDLISSEVLQRLDVIRSYELSNQAKMVEFQQIIEEYYNSLSNDERLRIENEVSNRMNDYLKQHMRELERLGIVKIGLDDFSVKTTGDIPGRPLNQFSLDEYETNLRVATTVGGRMFTGTAESANDVYVLDENLNPLGKVTDLGLGERIYSARFIGDKGYLVTFKQIDPFYVLDLSDPRNPQVKGELKIPGYSSYLHPINEESILGVGKEGQKVKLSLFEVSDPSNPEEVSKYLLDEYWSDVLETHHAFLLDKDHQVFFMPGNKGGYVFSYENKDILLKKAVSGVQARRAIYINDYMYIIGNNKIVVLDETNWEQINSLDF